MPFQPIDEVDVPEQVIKDLEAHKLPEDVTASSEADKTPDTKVVEEKVPFHRDPEVQLYIERQVAKRLGEGSKAYEDRLDSFEKRLSDSPKGPTTIGGWKPSNESDEKAARAIILQAKKEMAEELQTLDRTERERVSSEDREFTDFLGELRVTGTLKSDDDEIEFARLIAEYKLDDRDAAVGLWNRLNEAKIEAEQRGEQQGERKAQEAKIGSSRRSGEPGQQARSYQQRRMEEPNFDAIVDRELTRMGR